MTGRRSLSVLLWTLFAAAIATAALSLNVLLLGRATGGNDPVGRLTPRASIPAAPHWTVRPTHTRLEGRSFDD